MGSFGSKAANSASANEDCATSACGGDPPRASDETDAVSRASSFSVDTDAFVSPREDGEVGDLGGLPGKSAKRAKTARVTVAAAEATAAAAAAAAAACDLLVSQLSRKRRRDLGGPEEGSSLLLLPKRRRGLVRTHAGAVGLRRGLSRRVQKLHRRKALLEGAVAQSRQQSSEAYSESRVGEAEPLGNEGVGRIETREQFTAEKRSQGGPLAADSSGAGGCSNCSSPEDSGLPRPCPILSGVTSPSASPLIVEDSARSTGNNSPTSELHSQPSNKQTPSNSIVDSLSNASCSVPPAGSSSPASAPSAKASHANVRSPIQMSPDHQSSDLQSPTDAAKSFAMQKFLSLLERGGSDDWRVIRTSLENTLEPLEVQKAARVSSLEVWKYYGRMEQGVSGTYFCLCEVTLWWK